MLDPLTHEDRALPEEEAINCAGRRLQDVVDLLHQLRSESLISVQVKDPVAPNRCVVLSPITLRRVVVEGVFQDSSSRLLGDGHGLVCATRVNYDDITAQPAKALQAMWQIGLLIVCQDYCGDSAR